MRHIPKLIFAAGILMLVDAIYKSATIGWFGASYQNSMITAAIGILVAAAAAQIIFVDKS
ncbi:hypothetical protein RA280_07645 [Cupriavidus sp. CV2]|uniref:hypothetical protein n=1 Tax=Cupriavidus ulmosensis TaxID=3065913 RepID=UPI00296A9D8C|nr:hypothetical protein [Cupriavidus sp. CV2]MDW3681622.1 hypothetical protein [Cupriavidus sp. CV2]